MTNDRLAAEVEGNATIVHLMGPTRQRMTLERATMVARLAARNIRADETGRLTRTRALVEASRYEFDAAGDPQVFPYDNASARCIRLANALDADDHSAHAEGLREVAQSVRDHRVGYRQGHTATCRGDLYRGLCH